MKALLFFILISLSLRANAEFHDSLNKKNTIWKVQFEFGLPVISEFFDHHTLKENSFPQGKPNYYSIGLSRSRFGVRGYFYTLDFFPNYKRSYMAKYGSRQNLPVGYISYRHFSALNLAINMSFRSERKLWYQMEVFISRRYGLGESIFIMPIDPIESLVSANFYNSFGSGVNTIINYSVYGGFYAAFEASIGYYNEKKELGNTNKIKSFEPWYSSYQPNRIMIISHFKIGFQFGKKLEN